MVPMDVQIILPYSPIKELCLTFSWVDTSNKKSVYSSSAVKLVLTDKKIIVIAVRIMMSYDTRIETVKQCCIPHSWLCIYF